MLCWHRDLFARCHSWNAAARTDQHTFKQDVFKSFIEVLSTAESPLSFSRISTEVLEREVPSKNPKRRVHLQQPNAIHTPFTPVMCIRKKKTSYNE